MPTITGFATERGHLADDLSVRAEGAIAAQIPIRMLREAKVHRDDTPGAVLGQGSECRLAIAFIDHQGGIGG